MSTPSTPSTSPSTSRRLLAPTPTRSPHRRGKLGSSEDDLTQSPIKNPANRVCQVAQTSFSTREEQTPFRRTAAVLSEKMDAPLLPSPTRRPPPRSLLSPLESGASSPASASEATSLSAVSSPRSSPPLDKRKRTYAQSIGTASPLRRSPSPEEIALSLSVELNQPSCPEAKKIKETENTLYQRYKKRLETEVESDKITNNQSPDAKTRRKIFEALALIENYLKGFAPFYRAGVETYIYTVVTEYEAPLPELGCLIYYLERNEGHLNLNSSQVDQRVYEVRKELRCMEAEHHHLYGLKGTDLLPSAKTDYFLRALCRVFVTPKGTINPAGGAAARILLDFAPHNLSPTYVETTKEFCRHFDMSPIIHSLFSTVLSTNFHHSLENFIRAEWQLPADHPITPELRCWIVLKTLLSPYTQRGLSNCYVYASLPIILSQAPELILKPLIEMLISGDMTIGTQALPAYHIMKDRHAPYESSARGLVKKYGKQGATVLERVADTLGITSDKREEFVPKVLAHPEAIQRLSFYIKSPFCSLLEAYLEHLELNIDEQALSKNFFRRVCCYLEKHPLLTKTDKNKDVVAFVKQKMGDELVLYFHTEGVHVNDQQQWALKLFGEEVVADILIGMEESENFDQLYLVIHPESKTIYYEVNKLAEYIYGLVKTFPGLEEQEGILYAQAMNTQEFFEHIQVSAYIEADPLSLAKKIKTPFHYIKHEEGSPHLIMTSLGLHGVKEYTLTADPIYGMSYPLLGKELITRYLISGHHCYTFNPHLSQEFHSLNQEDFKLEVEAKCFKPYKDRLHSAAPKEILALYEYPKQEACWGDLYAWARKQGVKQKILQLDKYFHEIPPLTEIEIRQVFDHIQFEISQEALEALATHLKVFKRAHAFTVAQQMINYIQKEWGCTFSLFAIYQAICKQVNYPTALFIGSLNWLDDKMVESAWPTYLVYLPDPFKRRLVPYILTSDNIQRRDPAKHTEFTICDIS